MGISDTSRDAHSAISLRARKSLGDQIETVVVRAELEKLAERRVDMSIISARVNDLVAAKRLARSE